MWQPLKFSKEPGTQKDFDKRLEFAEKMEPVQEAAGSADFLLP